MATKSIQRHTKKKKTSKKKPSEIDRLVYFAIVIGPLLTLPQVYTIWARGEKGVSVISWLAYLIASLIWLAYGVHHKDKPIITVELLWIILEVLIIIGIVRLH